MPGPAVGSIAPDFTLPRAPARDITLGDYRGQRIVVVSFVALCFTGGFEWGVEGTLRAFDRTADEFDDAGAVVLAISGDSMYCNEAFSRSLGGLRVPLLADFLPRGAVSRQWDCWAEDREHPRNVTVVVDRQGVVRSSEHHRKGGAPDMATVLAAVEAAA